MTKRPTKQETVLKLLKRPQGATVAQLQKATGWQPHSVRAALSGLRKQEYVISRGKNTKSMTVYSVEPKGDQ